MKIGIEYVINYNAYVNEHSLRVTPTFVIIISFKRRQCIETDRAATNIRRNNTVLVIVTVVPLNVDMLFALLSQPSDLNASRGDSVSRPKVKPLPLGLTMLREMGIETTC